MAKINHPSTFVVVNPASQGGKASETWLSIKDKLLQSIGAFDYQETREAGHAIRIAREASERNYKIIIAMGGDGTIHEVVNGIMTAETAQKPSLGLLGVGTGGDFIRSLNYPRRIEEQIHLLKTQRTITIDIGFIEYNDRLHQKKSRYFINIADLGLGGETVRRMHAMPFSTKRKWQYLTQTLASFVSWKPIPLKITVGDEDEAGRQKRRNPLGRNMTIPVKKQIELKPLVLIMANGSYFGGGMPIAKNAKLNDGLLDVIALNDLPLWMIPVAIPLLYAGKIHLLPQAHYWRTSEIIVSNVQATSLPDAQEIPLDIDGEPAGYGPVRVRLLPAALKVITKTGSR